MCIDTERLVRTSACYKRNFFQSKVKDKEKRRRGFCIFQGAVIIYIRGQR